MHESKCHTLSYAYHGYDNKSAAYFRQSASESDDAVYDNHSTTEELSRKKRTKEQTPVHETRLCAFLGVVYVGGMCLKGNAANLRL
jgi:hypothetical protein